MCAVTGGSNALTLNPGNVDDADIDTLLGIDPSLSKKEKCKKITKEYAKWNSRLNSLAEGKQKENAQRMLELIPKARKKYDC